MFNIIKSSRHLFMCHNAVPVYLFLLVGIFFIVIRTILAVMIVALSRARLLVMDPTQMVSHVIHATEQARTSFPFTSNGGVMSGLVTRTIFLTGESPR